MAPRTTLSLTIGKGLNNWTRPVRFDKRLLFAVRQSCVRNVMICLIAAALTIRASPDQATDLLIYQVEARYNSTKTLSVDFTETYSILGHSRPPETGTLTLRKVGKMRWDYRQPAGKLFISDGKTVYLYTARDNRVEKVSLKATDDMRAPLAFLLGKLDMKKEFSNTSERPAGDKIWLIARSKNDRLPYQSVEMLVGGGGQISQLLVRGRDESVTSYQFQNEKLNPAVSDALFHFQIPPGAQVLDSLETHSGDAQ